jgi:hypothetical protein
MFRKQIDTIMSYEYASANWAQFAINRVFSLARDLFWSLLALGATAIVIRVGIYVLSNR